MITDSQLCFEEVILIQQTMEQYVTNIKTPLLSGAYTRGNQNVDNLIKQYVE